jgi:hypothetical protein
VAFRVSTFVLSRPEEVVAGDGGPPTVIDHDVSFDFFHFGSFPALNSVGLVAYSLADVNPARPERALNIGDGQTTTTLYSDQDGVFASFGNPVLNEAGTVAFVATLAGGGSGVFAGNGGPVTAVAQDGSVFSAFEAAPALNNYGGVAFAATLADGTGGIFTGSDVPNDTVIAVGDALDGATVTELHFFRQGLNDNGQLAFFAGLDNGTSGIFRADPARSPGPRHAHAAPEAVPVVLVPAASGTDIVPPVGTGMRPEQAVRQMSPRPFGQAAVGTPSSERAQAM